MYSYFSFVFSTALEKVELLKISKVIQLLWKSLPPCKMGEKKRINFSIFQEHLSVFSPNAKKCRKNADQNNSEYGHFLRGSYCTLLFSRKEHIKCSEVVLVAAQLHYDCVGMSTLKYYQYNSVCLLVCHKRQ